MDVGTYYLASFSWSIMVITGTGGTDFYPSSLSNAETLIVVTLVIFGALLWTQVLALFCDVATNANPAIVEFRQHLDSLNRFISMSNVPDAMAMRLREYMHQQQGESLRKHATHHALERLSPALQIEVILHCHRHWLDKIWFLADTEELSRVRLAMSMESTVLAPGEIAPLGYLYVVTRGLVLFGGRVLMQGSSWGDDIILHNPDHHAHCRARAMSYVDAHTLSREVLVKVLSVFPAASEKVRRATIVLALRRHLVVAAKALRNKKMQGSVPKSEDFLDRTHSAACKITDKKDLERIKSVDMSIQLQKMQAENEYEAIVIDPTA